MVDSGVGDLEDLRSDAVREIRRLRTLSVGHDVDGVVALVRLQPRALAALKHAPGVIETLVHPADADVGDVIADRKKTLERCLAVFGLDEADGGTTARTDNH